MKKSVMQLALVVLILLVEGYTVVSSQAVTTSSSLSSEAKMISYTWYRDDALTDPTGTVSDINAELNRLRNQYPWYIFSASPGAGLAPFEYGYHPVFSDVLIFSDCSL